MKLLAFMADNNMGTWILIGVLLLMFVGLYFFSNFSNRKRAEAHNEMVKKLKIGDKVTTIGGVYGNIFEINEEYIVIETGSENNKSYIKFNIAAIASFAPQAAEANEPGKAAEITGGKSEYQNKINGNEGPENKNDKTE